LKKVREILVNNIKNMLPTWYKKYKRFIEENIEIYLDKYFEKNKNNSEALQKFEEIIRYSVK